MAYDRTPRFTPISFSQTGPNVCPNTYQTVYDDRCDCKGANWAPFLSCAGRTSKKVTFGPAPNAYFPEIKKRIIGGSSLRYTAPRFQETVCLHSCEEKPEEKAKERLKGYMYLCHVPYTLLGYPPTIPNIEHVGYKILEDRSMVECCIPDHDTTLGPAFYHVNYSTFCTCYKGSYWSRYSKRSPIAMNDTPGVGTYNIVPEPNPMDEFINKLRQERKKNASSLRYLDIIENQALKNNYPAPNQYTVGKIKSVNVKKKRVPKQIERVRKPFVPPRVIQVPRPCRDKTFLYLKKRKGYNSTFARAPRFPKKSLEVSPGPTDYYLQSFVDELAKKVSPYAVRNTAFDTSVPKKLYYLPPINWEEVLKCPEYGLKPKPPPPPPPPPPVHPFASKTKRFTEPKAFDVSYNIHHAFCYLKDKKSFRKALRYNFLVNEERFTRMTGFFGVDDKSYMPFLAYDLLRQCQWKNGRSFPKAKRFPEVLDSDSPGPLKYDGKYACCKHTFNVTLRGKIPLNPMQEYRMKLKRKPFEALEVKGKNKKSQEECRKVPSVKIEFPL